MSRPRLTLRRRARAALLALAGVAVLGAGCSSTPDRPPPTPLPSVKAKIAGRQVWRASVDSLSFPLQVAVTGDAFIVAGDRGRVASYAAADGALRWQAELGTRLAAGVGSDGRVAAVVSADNELIVFEAAPSARVLWRARLKSRVTTAPLVAGERVFVMGVDRVVDAYDALDGRRLWTLQRPGDALTLSQASVVLPYRNTLVVGQGARMTGVDPLRGDVRWDVPVATPRGTNEVERLADVVGPAARSGSTLCARAFQSAVGCVDAERGSALWARNASGRQGVAIGEDLLYGADAADRITAWKLANGDTAWTTDAYLNRGLTAPATIGRTLVFGDAQGQLLFLAGDSGDLLLNLPTDNSPVVTTPVVAGTTLLVVTRNGSVLAYRPE